jgi:PEGA domain
MALFGSFETEREVYSDPIYTVYSARRSGEPKADYALKVFSIQQVGFDAETAEELAPLLVDIEGSRIQCIEVQAQGAANSKYIAPVLEKGQDERGVWYATRFYPRSVNKIIIGKVALTRDAVLHVIRSVAQGAHDLKRTCGRSHGEILPSNVQISRSEKLVESEIVISDPLPGGESDAVSFEINDLRSIGRILLQLVQQRAIGNEDDFLILPILTSEQWTNLFGKDADTWLGLCNRLLDPNLSLEDMTLERLVTELEGLQPKKSFSPKLAFAVAAGILGLALIVVLMSLPRAQLISVTSDPPGATILVDKKDQGHVTPLKLKLKKGSYIIEAQHSRLRLQSITTNIVVPGAIAILHFKFAYGSVAIRSDPPGATIRSQTGVVGKTPADPGGFVIPVVPAGTEVKYELEVADRAKKTVSGVVTNGQWLILTETLPLSK